MLVAGTVLRCLFKTSFSPSHGDMGRVRRRIPPGDNICFFCLGCLKNPVVLRCSHRLCKSCVQSYWEMTQSLKCPVCLREMLCKVSLEHVSTEMSVSNSGDLHMGDAEGEMVSAYLSWLVIF